MNFNNLFSLTIFISFTNAHLVLNIPEVWGINNGVSLEQPLDENTNNPICAGQSPQELGIVNIIAGESYKMETICGEKDLNSPGCLIGSWHVGNNNDYSGCALSVNYDNYESMNDYKYISYSEQCPKRGTTTDFIISKNVKNCDKCICSWTWAPSRMYSSPGQFYHNCFYCSITGGTNSSVTMKPLDFINIKGSQYSDIVYKDLNLNSIYTEPVVEPVVEPVTSTSSLITSTVPSPVKCVKKFRRNLQM
jgi:hypothetical protein